MAYASFLYTAICLNLSPTIQALHTADTLLPSLISTLDLTPWYWSENRVGMLVPWLTSLVGNPLNNLLLQTQIHCIAAVAAVILLAAVSSTSPWSYSMLARAQLLLACLILSVRPAQLSMGAILLAHTYLISLAFALAALVVAMRGRRRDARSVWIVALLSITAFWANVASFPFCILVVLLTPGWRDCAEKRWRLLILATLVVAFIPVYLWQKMSPGPDFMAWRPLGELPFALAGVAENAGIYMLYPWRVASITTLGVLLFGFCRRRANAGQTIHRGFVISLILAATGLAVVTAGSEWAKNSGYVFRIVTSPAFVLIFFAYLPLAESLRRLIGRCLDATPASVSMSIALIVFSTAILGVPSLRAARAAILNTSRMDSQEITALGCTHLVGSYWNVWPRVFYHMATSDAPLIWGVTFRSDVTRRLWNGYPQQSRVYCAVANDPEIEVSRRLFDLPPLTPRNCKGNLCSFSAQLSTSVSPQELD